MAEMQPTTMILEKIRKNSNDNKEEVFTRLYRYMLRPDLYYLAYKNLYANNGASTKGVNDDTADGFGEEKITKIIKSLADETYTPNPARRTYIKKSNGKMRPLGIPTFTDKLVQEVLRMILEAVYEPMFLNCSHGFRPNKSCHTALKQLKNEFTGVRWFIEGDIKGCFDNIDHTKLIGSINDKIKDARIIKLIWKLVKAGYVEDWHYHATYSGTPQGGIISPIFANIYLHELDKLMIKIADKFEQPRERGRTKEYDHVQNLMGNIKKKLKTAEGEERLLLIERKKLLRKELFKIPCKSQTDKRLRYIRYADDFLIGVCGNKEDCQTIKQQLSDFIGETLKMELSNEKTLITHSNTKARFLGYDIRVRRDGTIKPGNADCTRRTLSNMVELSIPFEDKIMKFLFENNAIEQKNGEIKPIPRYGLFNCTELEIVTTYNAELRGKCNYYSLACDYNKLSYFGYLMEYSCLLTLCAKHKSTIGKIKAKYKDGKGKWCIPYETKQGRKYRYFVKIADCKNASNPSDKIENISVMNKMSKTTFESRLSAKICELCGATDAERYEMHHVHKVKDLKGKKPWERAMISKRRKTLAVCKRCHNTIHYK